MLKTHPDIKQIIKDIYIDHINNCKGIGLNYRFNPANSDGELYTRAIYLPAICPNNRCKYFPKRISKKKDSPTLNLICLRRRQQYSGNTNNANKLYEYLMRRYSEHISVPNLTLIREYPIPIDRIDIWTNIIIKEFGPDWYNKYKNNSAKDISGFIYRSFICLDIYSPQQKIAIEADSTTYHTGKINEVLDREKMDRVRDEYLKTLYDMDTVRVKEFNPASKNECDKLEKVLNGYSVSRMLYYPEYKNLSLAFLNLNDDLINKTARIIETIVQMENRSRDLGNTQINRILTRLITLLYYDIKDVKKTINDYEDIIIQKGNFLTTMKSIVNNTVIGLDSYISDTDIENFLTKMVNPKP